MYYPIQLDKARNFRYGMKAISLIEKKFKKPMAKIDFESMTMEEMAVFLWAGLAHEDRDLTPDKVMDLVDEHSDVVTAVNAAMEAVNAKFGGKVDTEAKNG